MTINEGFDVLKGYVDCSDPDTCAASAAAAAAAEACGAPAAVADVSGAPLTRPKKG